MKQKYVMPEMAEMKAAFDEFYSKAQEFIKKMKKKERSRKNEIA